MNQFVLWIFLTVFFFVLSIFVLDVWPIAGVVSGVIAAWYGYQLWKARGAPAD